MAASVGCCVCSVGRSGAVGRHVAGRCLQTRGASFSCAESESVVFQLWLPVGEQGQLPPP